MKQNIREKVKEGFKYWEKKEEAIFKRTLAEVRKVINKDIKYQKSKLEGNFEKDKPFKWRIEGCNYIKRQIKIK